MTPPGAGAASQRGFSLPRESKGMEAGGSWLAGGTFGSSPACRSDPCVVRRSGQGAQRQPAEAWRAMAGILWRQQKTVRAFKQLQAETYLLSTSLWRQWHRQREGESKERRSGWETIADTQQKAITAQASGWPGQ